MSNKTINSYYTDTGVSIDRRLADGRTKLFETKIAAESFAKQKRSSVYQVFDVKRKAIAWAVPK